MPALELQHQLSASSVQLGDTEDEEPNQLADPGMEAHRDEAVGMISGLFHLANAFD